MRQSKSSCDGWYCSCDDLSSLSNSLGAKNSRKHFFHKFLCDSWFAFENHVDATNLSRRCSFRVFADCSALFKLSSGATTIFPKISHKVTVSLKSGILDSEWYLLPPSVSRYYTVKVETLSLVSFPVTYPFPAWDIFMGAGPPTHFQNCQGWSSRRHPVARALH
jgi:hypothetical protein